MRMQIIRGETASGIPRRIITCSGCGKSAPEAGLAVRSDDVEENGLMMAINSDDVSPLCEACVSALEVGE